MEGVAKQACELCANLIIRNVLSLDNERQIDHTNSEGEGSQ